MSRAASLTAVENPLRVTADLLTDRADPSLADWLLFLAALKANASVPEKIEGVSFARSQLDAILSAIKRIEDAALAHFPEQRAAAAKRLAQARWESRAAT